jgi:hypothetical protein
VLFRWLIVLFSLHLFPRSSRPSPDVRALLIVLVSGLVLWSLAYQVVTTVSLPIGGDPATHRRHDDAPFLRGFNAPEPAGSRESPWWEQSPGYPYRWTTRNAEIRFPGMGGAGWIVTLAATSGRPGNEPTMSRWQVGAQQVDVLLSASPRQYHILARAPPAGDLAIQMDTPGYTPPDDPRDLGFVLRGVRIAPTRANILPPAPAQIGWLLLSLFLSYALLRWLHWSPRPATLVILASVVLLGVLLATHRLSLTLFTPTLAILAILCWLLALPMRYLLRSFLRAFFPGCATYPTAPVLALVLVAFALRLGGMLHPYAIFSDHYMNANNLLEVGLGNIYFTEGLPQEAGGGQAPYPPGSYLVAAPLLLAAPGDIESRVVVVQSSVALLDSLVVALVWLLLLRAGVGQRAALFGAALYLAPAPMLASFSIGEYANIGGQALALPVIALLALLPPHPPPPSVPLKIGFVVLLCVGWLGHLGVAISLALLLAGWWLSEATLALLKKTPTARLIQVPLGGLLATGVVLLIYYSAPPFVAIVAEKLHTPATSTPASTPHTSPLAILVGTVMQMIAPGNRLGPILVAGGVVGAVLLWQRRGNATGLAHVVLAWWVGVGISFGLLLVARQGVRWQHFLFPALCLGAGPLLATLWRRGGAGRLVAGGGVLIPLSHGLIGWVVRISSYLHE